MQQRQLRLGDVLDDYCPRERRLTNHVVVAMVGDNVKQTRCTTCDADHEYKQAKLPRLRRKTEPPAALAAQGFGAAPKLHDQAGKPADGETPVALGADHPQADDVVAEAADGLEGSDGSEGPGEDGVEPPTADEGPVHRRLIRAALPRPEGQAPPSRPNPEFTIRQPNNNRQNRFRPRHGGGRGPMQSSGGNGNRSFGGGGFGGGQQRQNRHGGGNQGRRRGPK